jgi:hypothetical protein
MNEDIHTTTIYTDRPDIIEIGTPGKGGTIKLHFDARNTDEMEKLYAAAKNLLIMARAELQ